MAAPRLRKAGSKKELESVIDDYITQGYELINRGESSALLRKKTWGSPGGHLLCVVLTGIFTFGIGNAAYATYAHFNAEQVMVKLDQDHA